MKDSRQWLYDYERCSAPVSAGDWAGRRYGVLGIDEAGRGAWVGPVVAAAAYILPEAYADSRLRGHCERIDDSKKLSRAERDVLFTQITGWRDVGLVQIAAGQASVEEIEAHNIVGATAIAMRRAVEALALPCALPAGPCIKVGGKRAAAVQGAQASAHTTRGQCAPRALQGDLFSVSESNAMEAEPSAQAAAIAPPHVWVDGIPMAKRLPWGHAGIVSGDGTSLAIAMASIWAKVTRDRLLAQLAAAFPAYGWETNAGYGTASHIRALRAHGCCLHHRPKFLQKQNLGPDASQAAI